MPRANSFVSLASRSTAADRLVKAAQQQEYVRDLWIILGSIMALLTVIRLIRLVALHLIVSMPPAKPLSAEKTASETNEPGYCGRPSWRQIPSALTTAFRIVAFRLHIPIGPSSVLTVSELSFILGYIAVVLVLLFVKTHDLNSFWFEDRAAHYASSQLPLVVALAGKNNIISFCIGISHEKLNVLHRAAARTCLILLWIHALCRVVSGLSPKFDFTHVWMQCGVVGLAAFTFAAILSVRPIRTAFFEIFLVGHIVLIAMFLLFGYLHARELGFGSYIWPALVLWALDRALRLLRLLLNNRFGWTKNKDDGTAVVEILSQDSVRLTLRRRMYWKAGQHAYVILPTISDLPTEAHPFTIATIPESLGETEVLQEKELSFIIRGRSGFTARLREHALGGGSKIVPAFIDGPYGCPPDLRFYSTCILIAGGSGVSYTLPLLQSLVYAQKAGRSSVRRVIFVWSVRDAEHIKWISKILDDVMSHSQSTSLTVDPRIYVTGPDYPHPAVITNDGKTNSGSSTPTSPSFPILEKVLNEKLELPNYSALKITHGRPSITQILHDEISASLGPVSVDVAGPSALARVVSKALSSNVTSPSSVLKGAPSVTLHVEVFGI